MYPLYAYTGQGGVWQRAKTGETIWHAGGQWDRIEQRYTGKNPRSGKIVKLREAQIEAARLCAFWYQEKKEGRHRDFFGEFLLSDRGAGKTHLADALVLLGPTLGFAVTVRDNGSSGEDGEVTARADVTDATRAQLNILVKRPEQ